ncbi:Uncharacterized protein 015R [Durusdinium trenchii]|uniref:Uncharacterized protein 015R n=1 Tax=Durusdinium trenchii TaxID=1381693 RepID=A0ABP0SSN3_9DINO
MAEEGAEGLDEQQLDSFGARFRALNVSEQELVMRAPALTAFGPKAKAVYSYLTEMCDKGKNNFTVPAMLVPAMLGMAWGAAQHQKDFVRNYLKEQGQEGVDWVFFRKSDLTFNGGLQSTIDFPVPGGDGATLTFKASCGAATKFPFVTPHFARVLVLRSNTPVGRCMAEFYLAVHDEVLKFLRGEASGFDNMPEPERVSPLKRKREELEMAEIRRREFFAAMNAMRDVFGMDDRDLIYYKDVAKEVLIKPLIASAQPFLAIKDAPGGGASSEAVEIENGGRGGVISIAMVCRELGVNPRGKMPQIGRKMAQYWRERHGGESPPKRRTLYFGRPYMEYTYYDCDRELMVKAIREGGDPAEMNFNIDYFDPSKMRPGAVVLVIGRRGSGKSTLSADILSYQRHCKRGVCVSATELANPFWSRHIPRCFIHHEYRDKITQDLFKTQKKVKDRLGHNEPAFAIFDDIMFDKKFIKSVMTRRVFMNGRHDGIFTLVTTQWIMDVPPDLRANVDYVFILRDNIRVMKQLTQGREAMVIDQGSLSYNISDSVSFYKATPDLRYRLGAPEYWAYSAGLALREEATEEDGEGKRPDKGGTPKDEAGVTVVKNYPKRHHEARPDYGARYQRMLEQRGKA